MERPTRTREHWLADLSINYVERFILRQGHSAQRVQYDYGYDLFMQTFDYGGDAARKQGTYEGGLVYFQFKATHKLTALEDGVTIALPVARRHVELWRTESMPVILIMFDMATEQAYWLYVQQHLRAMRQTWPVAQKEVSLRMSMSNVVDENAIEQFRQFKAEALQQIEEGTNLHE